MTRNFFFPNKLWKHPTTYFLILLLLPFLVIFSNYPTLAFTTDLTPTLVLVYPFIFINSAIVIKGDIMVDLGWGGGEEGLAISVVNSERMFLCV